MAKVVRYSIATFCFTVSVGCLGLWGWSVIHSDRISRLSYSHYAGYSTSFKFLGLNAGEEFLYFESYSVHWTDQSGWRFQSTESRGTFESSADLFGLRDGGVYFPILYPALIFALTGVGVLRVSRHYSIRSALIATTVIAALIGMAVIL